MKWLQLGRKKKESITAGSTAFGSKVGQLLLKGYCGKEQMGKEHNSDQDASLNIHRK